MAKQNGIGEEMYHSINDNCIGCSACKNVCPTDAILGEKKELHIIIGKLCINCSSCGRVCPKGAVTGYFGRIIEKVKRSEWLKPVISREKCYACENCVAVCPVKALSMFDESFPLTDNYALLSSPEKCISSCWCFDNCQFNSITMEVSVESN
jgi:electron transport complex protein RnfB